MPSSGSVTQVVSPCAAITVGHRDSDGGLRIAASITDVQPGDSIRFGNLGVDTADARDISIDFVNEPLAVSYAFESAVGCRAQGPFNTSPAQFPIFHTFCADNDTLSFLALALASDNTALAYAVLDNLPLVPSGTITGSITSWRTDFTAHTVTARNAPFAANEARASVFHRGNLVLSRNGNDLPDFGDQVQFQVSSADATVGSTIAAYEMFSRPAPTTHEIDLAVAVPFRIDSVTFDADGPSISWVTAAPVPAETLVVACSPVSVGMWCVFGNATDRSQLTFPQTPEFLPSGPTGGKPEVFLTQASDLTYAQIRSAPFDIDNFARQQPTGRKWLKSQNASSPLPGRGASWFLP